MCFLLHLVRAPRPVPRHLVYSTAICFAEVATIFLFPALESEEMLKRGVALEEAGRLLEACKLYERVLASEPENLELRQYVGGIANQINMRISEDSRQARSAGATIRPQLSGDRPGSAPTSSASRRGGGGSWGDWAAGGVGSTGSISLHDQMRPGIR